MAQRTQTRNIDVPIIGRWRASDEAGNVRYEPLEVTRTQTIEEAVRRCLRRRPHLCRTCRHAECVEVAGQSMEDRSTLVTFLDQGPALRAEPRFSALVQQLGIPRRKSGAGQAISNVTPSAK